MTPRDSIKVALLPWGDLWEEYLDSLGVSFETFRDEFLGSWIFGYAEALRSVGVSTVIMCFSARTSNPWCFTHKPTTARICILPASRGYIAARRHVASWKTQSRDTHSWPRRYLRLAVARGLPYLNTPVVTLARALRRESCNVLLCQEYDYARFDVCVALGHLLRIPVFASFQGGKEPVSTLERRLRCVSIQYSAGLVIGAEGEARRARARYNVPYTKIARIFNPVDTAKWKRTDRHVARSTLQIPPHAKVVAWHGRVDIAQKGLDTLLEAWLQMCQARPDEALTLLLIGTGADSVELRQQLYSREVPGVYWVDEFVNEQARLRQYLSAADVYTLPSRAEGFPVSPIEAMACGLPVVAADASGVSDILEGGEAAGGVVVDRNDPVALSRELLRLLDDADLRERLSKRARQRAEERFSLNSTGAQLHRFLMSPVVHPSEAVAIPWRSDLPPLGLLAMTPASTAVGGQFNVQPDGQSALSLTVENATRSTQVVMDTTKLYTVYNSQRSLSALVPGRLTRRPGTYHIRLVDGLRTSNTIAFLVEAIQRPVLLCLHPARIFVGEGFNVQPDGQSALAVEAAHVVPGTVIVFANMPLQTVYVNASLLTAIIPAGACERAGRYTVYLQGGNGTSNSVDFVVQSRGSDEVERG